MRSLACTSFPVRIPLAGFALAVLAAAEANGFSSGPPNGYTGAPGDNLLACAQCHAHLNIGDGNANLVGPSAYVPGDTLEFRVALQKLGQSRWGFEATALNSTRQPAGTILVADPVRTALETATNGRQYVKQTAAGTDPAVPDVAPGWIFRWIAPPRGTGTVTLYLAGNATDNNSHPSGDFVYTTALRLEETQTAVLARSWGAIKGLYRSQP